MYTESLGYIDYLLFAPELHLKKVFLKVRQDLNMVPGGLRHKSNQGKGQTN